MEHPRGRLDLTMKATRIRQVLGGAVVVALIAACAGATPSASPAPAAVSVVPLPAFGNAATHAKQRIDGEQTRPVDSARTTAECPMPLVRPDTLARDAMPVLPPDSGARRMPTQDGDCAAGATR